MDVLEEVGMSLLGILFLCLLTVLLVDLCTGFGLWAKPHRANLFGFAFAGGLGLSILAAIQGTGAPEVVTYEVKPPGPPKGQFLETTAYFGSEVEPDAQGRFVIPPILREAAQLTGEVAVLGQMDHLALWNKAGFQRRLAAEPLGSDDLAQLADLGI